MPPRAAPGDRAALERALRSEPSLWAALQRIREIHDVHDWQEVPAVATLFHQTAAVLLAAEIAARERRSVTGALEAAARELGLAENTVRDRAKRWPRDSRRVSSPPETSEPGAYPTSTGGAHQTTEAA